MVSLFCCSPCQIRGRKEEKGRLHTRLAIGGERRGEKGTRTSEGYTTNITTVVRSSFRQHTSLIDGKEHFGEKASFK